MCPWPIACRSPRTKGSSRQIPTATAEAAALEPAWRRMLEMARSTPVTVSRRLDGAYAWRSLWEVEADIRAGRLQSVLEATLQKMDAEKKMLADIAAGKLDTAWIDATLRRIGCNPDPQ